MPKTTLQGGSPFFLDGLSLRVALLLGQSVPGPTLAEGKWV